MSDDATAGRKTPEPGPAQPVLHGKRVAILATHGFEQRELIDPMQALERAGAHVDVVSPQAGSIRGWAEREWGMTVKVDRTLDEAVSGDYDALVLPGGVMNPDALRINPAAVAFVRQTFEDGKPIAAICHGPWTLIDAGVTRGLTMTSWPSLRSDLSNAGANWVDREVVVDRGIVSSRKPADLPAFNQKMIEEFAEGRHGGAGHREGARAMPGEARH